VHLAKMLGNDEAFQWYRAEMKQMVEASFAITENILERFVYV
jgi:hypothetical protein